MNLQGVFTALVTPFSKGKVDYAKLKDILAMQVESGVAGIVPMGTTGESPTLSPNEHLRVIEATVNAVKGKCLVIAGTGANSTVEAIELTTEAKKAGVDATLQVTPYYNKPSQEGLYRHFSIIAEQTELPMVLYNVPGRSVTPIAIETIKRLSANPHIIAVKEAGGSVERVSQILDVCDLTVISGDDALTLPMISVGATGVISVASNVIPKEMKQLVDLALSGDFKAALEIHKKYYRLFSDMFIETNPVPVKAAMSMMGLMNEEYRLPLSPLGKANKEILKNTLESVNIL
jgi:4-hydroxy-tetrahydrodipicolinate synthase